MEKAKTKQAAWVRVLQGGVLAMVLYLAGHLLLALLVVRGMVGEGSCFPVTACLCLLSSFCGALVSARRCPWGTVPGALAAAALFMGLLVAGGALWWKGITWTGHGGVLLLCALGGGILAGLAGGSSRRGKKRRR